MSFPDTFKVPEILLLYPEVSDHFQYCQSPVPVTAPQRVPQANEQCRKCFFSHCFLAGCLSSNSPVFQASI